MSFPVTEATAMDAELARQTLLRLQFEDETRRQMEIKEQIEVEATRASVEAVLKRAYTVSSEETDLIAQLKHQQWLLPQLMSCGYGRTPDMGCRSHAERVKQKIGELSGDIEKIREDTRTNIRLEFIETATERAAARRLEERNAAQEALRLVAVAEEAARVRLMEEEAAQKEYELTLEKERMIALVAEQEKARLDAAATVEAFRVEESQPVMASMSIPTPILLVGGAAALLLLARKK